MPNEYKPGDRVVIISPPPVGALRNIGPGWVPGMDRWAGSVGTIRKCEAGVIYLLEPEKGMKGREAYSWDERWLSLEKNGASLYAWDKEEEELARLKGKRDEQLRQAFGC